MKTKPIAILASLLLTVVGTPVHSSTITWTNISGGNWSVPANWSPNQVPSASDDANITMAGTYSVALDIDTNVNNLTVGGAASGAQSLLSGGFNLGATNALIDSGGILNLTNSTFSGALVIAGGALVSVGNATLDAHVTVENGGQMLISEGSVSAIGVGANSWLWLQSGAQMTAAPGFALYLTVPVTNSGTCSFTDGDIGAEDFVNLTGGVINLISGASFYGFNGSTGDLLNEGTINVTNGTSQINLGQALLTGDYNAATGATVQLEADNASDTNAGAGLRLAGGGQYQFITGQLTLATNTIPNLQYASGTVVLGSDFQGGAITNLALNGSALNNSLPVTGTLTVTNSVLFGSYQVENGAALSINGATVDAQVTVENGGEMLLPGTVGSVIGNGGYADTNYWLWLQHGSQMIAPSGFVLGLFSPITNSGTCYFTDGVVYIYNDSIGDRDGGLVNLPGGVINLSGGISIYGYYGYDYLINEGTINVPDGTSQIGLGVAPLSGTYNAAAGAIVQFDDDSASGTSPEAGLTLGGGGQYQFISGLLTVTNYPIPNLPVESSATLALGPTFQGGAITNLTLNAITLTNTLPVTGTLSATNSTLLGTYQLTSGAHVSATNSTLQGSCLVPSGAILTADGTVLDAQVTVENGGEILFLADANGSSIGDGGYQSSVYWLWLQGGAQMAAASGFQLDLYAPITNSGTCSLNNGNVVIHNSGIYNAMGGLVNLPGGAISLVSAANISCSGVPEQGFDYLLNEGEIDVFSAGTNSLISVDDFTNAATLSIQHGTLELESTNLVLEPSGTLNVALNSATDFGSIAYSNTTALDLSQAGTFEVTLNGGYVPVVGTPFTVLFITNSGNFSGAFANFSSPDGAIFQTNYTASSFVLTNVGQITWAAPTNIVYGTALGPIQLDASTVPAITGNFIDNPASGTVLDSGVGRPLTATFSASNPTYASASFQVPITVLKAPLGITATNESKTYGLNLIFSGNEDDVNGLVNGDIVTSVSFASTGAISNAPVSGSPYEITPYNAQGDAGLTNYIIHYTNAVLTVKRAPLGITADSFAKTYGSNVIFAGTEFVSTTLSNNETIGTVTLSSLGAVSNAAVSGSPYNITPNSAGGGTFSPGNYTITFTNGLLTVNRADLTVTANPASRQYGLANPALSATYSGFVNNETASVVSGTPGFSTPASATSGIGGYTLTPSPGTLTAANYSFTTFDNGTLTITSAPFGIASGLSANNKFYDRTTAATLSSNNVVLTNIFNGDAISLNTNGYAANFATANPGNAVAVTVSGLTLSGARATNYALIQPTDLIANITVPVLRIAPGTQSIIITWPAAAAFALNQTPSLVPPVTWTSVTNTIIISGTNNTVTVPTAAAKDQYFELIGTP